MWSFDGPRIAAALGLTQGLLVNDFEALAASLAVLGPDDAVTLVEGQPDPYGVRLVLGPGTGFGAAALLTHGERGMLIPTESGHIGIGPEDQTEHRIWPALSNGVPRMTVEHLLSGSGLVRLHKAVVLTSGTPAPEVSAADVARLAQDGDPGALMTVVCFWRLLARVAGDLALIFRATGGVFIAGGHRAASPAAGRQGRDSHGFHQQAADGGVGGQLSAACRHRAGRRRTGSRRDREQSPSFRPRRSEAAVVWLSASLRLIARPAGRDNDALPVC